MTKVHIDNIFPTPVYISSVDVDGVELGELEYQTSGYGENGVMLSSNDFLLDQPHFFDLKSKIDEHMHHFYYSVMGFSRKTYPKMTSSWAVRSFPGQETSWHIHTNSFFSGVLYLSAPEGSGDISFSLNMFDSRQLTSPLQVPIDFPTSYNGCMHTIKPKTGMILLFPSSLNHKVSENLSQQERISVAFNFFLHGNFDIRTAKLVL
jgi:uncharacterized protein (TIGR02466 family)